MAEKRKFPEELLAKSVEERLKYFNNFMVAHPSIISAREALLRAISEPSGDSLVFVIGPSGVGKTTLRLKIEEKIISDSAEKMKQDKGYIPIVGVEAVAPDSGNFNWKDYYKRALAALSEPLIDNKVTSGAQEIFNGAGNYLPLMKRGTKDELRRALEKAFLHRKPNTFIIDEAQHIAKISSGRKLQDQMDCVKSLVNMTKTVHVLIGTYELEAFRNLSAQLSRRSRHIHIPRYKMEKPEDIKAFQSVLLTFQNYLPTQEEPVLMEHWEYFYERSIGCVGILKNWLNRALVLALQEKSRTVSVKHVKDTALTASQCERMALDIIEGESMFEEKDEGESRLQIILGMKEGAVSTENPNPRKRNRFPGRRKPTRDAVGQMPLGV